MQAVIYTRVSTDKQKTDRQISELKSYAKKNDITVSKVFQENISGSRPIHKRREGKKFLEYLKTNNIDLVMVSETSRLGRSAIDVQRTVGHLINEVKMNIYIHQQSLYLLDEEGNFKSLSKMFVDVLANFAAMELETLKDRTKSGLKLKQQEYDDFNTRHGLKKGDPRYKSLGRPIGTTKSQDAFLKEYSKVVKELEKGTSIRNTAKLCEVSESTVKRVKKVLKN